MKTFYVWMILTIAIVIIYKGLDLLFGASVGSNYFEIAFIAFVILWCEQVDKRKLK